MIFPDNIFKYTSNMTKHIPSLEPLETKATI